MPNTKYLQLYYYAYCIPIYSFHIQSVLLLLNIRAENSSLYQNLCHSLQQNQFHLKRINISMIYHPLKSLKKFTKIRYIQNCSKVLPSTLFSIPSPCVCSTRTGTAEQNKIEQQLTKDRKYSKVVKRSGCAQRLTLTLF